MSDDYEQAKLMLILRYGSVAKAYHAFKEMTLDEQRSINQYEYELILEYEYNSEYSVP